MATRARCAALPTQRYTSVLSACCSTAVIPIGAFTCCELKATVPVVCGIEGEFLASQHHQRQQARRRPRNACGRRPHRRHLRAALRHKVHLGSPTANATAAQSPWSATRDSSALEQAQRTTGWGVVRSSEENVVVGSSGSAISDHPSAARKSPLSLLSRIAHC